MLKGSGLGLETKLYLFGVLEVGHDAVVVVGGAELGVAAQGLDVLLQIPGIK